MEDKRSYASSHRSFFMFLQFKMYVCPIVLGDMLTYDTLPGDVQFSTARDFTTPLNVRIRLASLNVLASDGKVENR